MAGPFRRKRSNFPRVKFGAAGVKNVKFLGPLPFAVIGEYTGERYQWSLMKPVRPVDVRDLTCVTKAAGRERLVDQDKETPLPGDLVAALLEAVPDLKRRVMVGSAEDAIRLGKEALVGAGVGDELAGRVMEEAERLTAKRKPKKKEEPETDQEVADGLGTDDIGQDL